MARILTVGIATLDIINTVDGFPVEDDEVRATGQSVRRGGNATNTAVVLSQLGHECSWAGHLADDISSNVIRADLESYGVEMSAVRCVAGGRTPASYVTLNQQNGSRTIVHFRDLAEYSFAQFQQIDLVQFDWLHFEGRNVRQTRAMLDDVRQRAPGLPVSVEIEKPREDIESLCVDVGLLLYSRAYAVQQTVTQHADPKHLGPEVFLQDQHRLFPEAEHICTWGDRGAWGIGRDGELFHHPALPLRQIVDTLAAGDTFNAAMIHGKLSGQMLSDCLRDACQLAAQKCIQQGLRGLCT
ncbi:ketohexokinase [Beggiatoa alba]|nr:ketohexokinase [Beggiatoa alba]